MEQVLITPHCANPHCANPRSSYWRGLAERVAENVALVAAGEPPRGIVTTRRDAARLLTRRDRSLEEALRLRSLEPPRGGRGRTRL